MSWTWHSPGDTVGAVGTPPHLDLSGPDEELAEDVAEEVLHLVPGVDAVGAVQDDDDVHVGGAACQGGRSWHRRGTARHGTGSARHGRLHSRCAVGAMVPTGRRSPSRRVQMPVLKTEVPHVWDQSGAQAWGQGGGDRDETEPGLGPDPHSRPCLSFPQGEAPLTTKPPSLESRRLIPKWTPGPGDGQGAADPWGRGKRDNGGQSWGVPRPVPPTHPSPAVPDAGLERAKPGVAVATHPRGCRRYRGWLWRTWRWGVPRGTCRRHLGGRRPRGPPPAACGGRGSGEGTPAGVTSTTLLRLGRGISGRRAKPCPPPPPAPCHGVSATGPGLPAVSVRPSGWLAVLPLIGVQPPAQAPQPPPASPLGPPLPKPCRGKAQIHGKA